MTHANPLTAPACVGGTGELAALAHEAGKAAPPASKRFACAPDGAMSKADAPAPGLAEAMLAQEHGAGEPLAPAHEEPEQAASPASNRFACAPDGAMSKADGPSPGLAEALLACEAAAHEEPEQAASPASKRFACAPDGAMSKADAPAPVLAEALLAQEHGTNELAAAAHEEAKKEATPASKRSTCAPDGATSKADGPSPALAEAMLACEGGAHEEAGKEASPASNRFPCAPDGATRKADGPAPGLAEAMLAHEHGAGELAALAHEPEQAATPASKRLACAPDGAMGKADGPAAALAEALLAHEHGTNELAALAHEPEQAAPPASNHFPCPPAIALSKAAALTLTPLLHPLTRDVAVLTALDAPSSALSEALLAHKHGTALYRALGGEGEPSPEAMAPLLTDPLRRLMRLCAQCGEGELLAALALCPDPLSPEGLAALVERHRRQEAMALYALQLLWRLCGEGELPDAMALFPPEEGNPALEQLACDYVISQLKGGMSRA